MAPRRTLGQPFPAPPSQYFGSEGDELGLPPLPVGRFIRPPHRRALATPALVEGGPSEGQPSPSARIAALLPLQLVRNISLKSGPVEAMPVSAKLTPADGSEQSVATNGRGLVLYTSNNQDGFSVNGGRSFLPLDPSTTFPSAAGGFCCDQVVTYVPSIDRFVWVLQYWPGAGGKQDRSQPNVIRVATTTSAAFDACRARCWTYYDWTPSALGATPPAAGKTLQLDRPSVAFSERMLSLTAAFVYNPEHLIFGSVIWRFPLAQLGGVLSPSAVPVQFAAIKDISGDVRFAPAQNDIFQNSSAQFFANRESTSRLGLVRWLDRDPSPVFFEVDVPSIATKNNDGPTSASPSGADWSARYTAQDGHVVTGAERGRALWFGWNAGRDANKPDGGLIHVHDQPAVEFVGIDAATLQSDDYDSIEFTDAATVNPQLSFNGEGVLGVDFMYGGPTINPTFAVGFLRPDYAASVATKGDAADPSVLGTSGDYLGLAADPGQLNCFVAGGSAIKLSPTTPTTPAFLYHDPHYVVFGQKSHCTVPRTTLTDLHLTFVKQVSSVLTVTGTISPALSTRISVDYTPPDGKTFSDSVLTDANGNFSDSVMVGSDQAGPWSVSARWFGKGYYIGAHSGAVAVTVARPTPPPPPPPPPPGGAALTVGCPQATSGTFPATFEITGTLTPGVAGSPVVITFTPPTGAAVTDTVTTDSGGTYSDTVTVDATQIYATWTVHARFAGDATRTSADAQCTFIAHYP
jgi:hypothetical protein